MIDPVAGQSAVSSMRLAQRRAQEAAQGVDWLPGMEPGELQGEGVKVVTDGSGVVMTDEEIAAARNADPFAAAGADSIADAALEATLAEQTTDVRAGWVRETAALAQQGLILRLDAMQAIELRCLSELARLEGERTQPRAKVVDYLASRLLEEAAALEEAGPPWEGYQQQAVGEVAERLQELQPDQPDLDLLELVWAFESAHQARKGVLLVCQGWQSWSATD